MCAFSRDGQSLYCLRAPGPDGSRELFSTNLEGKAERVIGSVPRELIPRSFFDAALRLTLAPDGKSVTYSILKQTLNLWLLEGLAGAATTP